MGWQILYGIGGVIVFIASVIAAIGTIINSGKTPFKFFQKKRQQQEQEKNERVANIVTDQVMTKLQPDLDEIKQQNMEQLEEIEVLTKSSKDVLRREILQIYYHGKKTHSMHETERKMLDDLYNDYRAEHGNSYIEHIYDRMAQWKVLPDEED